MVQPCQLFDSPFAIGFAEVTVCATAEDEKISVSLLLTSLMESGSM